MNNTNLPNQTPAEPLRRRVIQHLWVLLALIAIAQAVYTASDYGNYLGEDEWWTTYTVLRGSTGAVVDRPLGLINLMPVYWLVGPHMASTQFFLTALRVAIAFLIYLIVWHFQPRKLLFAFTCGAVYLLWIENHFIYVASYARMGNLWMNVFSALLAIYLYCKYMAQPRPVTLLLAAIVAGISIMGYESGIPLLFAASFIIIIYRRNLSRARMVGFAVWLGAVILFTQNYVLRLCGILPRGYGAGLFVSLDPLRMIRMSAGHYVDLFSPLAFTGPINIAPYLLPISAALAAYGVGSLVMRRQTPADGECPGAWSDWRVYLTWLAVGLVAIWLGFAAFLPTILIELGEGRVDFLTMPGIAVVLASLMWFAGTPIPHQGLRRMVRGIALILVVSFGISTIGRVQDDMYTYDGTWETEAIYMRSLASMIPDVTPNTLFIYMQPSDQGEAPFVSGWSFEYSLRYAYEDRATGILPDDNQVISSWSIQEDGIAITPNPGEEGLAAAYTSFHRWDEIIFVTRDENYRAVILEEIPPEFYAPERAAAYDPYGRIEAEAFVPEPIRELYPPIQRLPQAPDLVLR